MASRKTDAPAPDDEVADDVNPPDQVDTSDWPRNEFGTVLNPEDGQPVFNTVTGESRSQYLARTWVENKDEILDQLEASIAADTTTPTETEE